MYLSHDQPIQDQSISSYIAYHSQHITFTLNQHSCLCEIDKENQLSMETQHQLLSLKQNIYGSKSLVEITLPQ